MAKEVIQYKLSTGGAKRNIGQPPNVPARNVSWADDSRSVARRAAQCLVFQMFTILYARYSSSRPGWEIFDVEQGTVVAFIEHEEGDFTDYPIGLRSEVSFYRTSSPQGQTSGHL